LVDYRKVLVALARVIPLLAFVDVCRSLPSLLPYLLERVSSLGLWYLALDATVVLTACSGVAAVLTAITGSVILYSVALILTTLSRIPPQYLASLGGALTEGRVPVLLPHTAAVDLPWVALAGFLTFLALDTLLTGYRYGESRTVVESPADVAKTLATFVALAIALLAIPLALSGYLVELLSGLARVYSGSPYTSASYSVGVALYIALLVLAARYVSSTAGVVAPFLLPSRRASLKFLRSTEELDTYFRPALAGTFLGLAVLVLLAPIRTMLFDILLAPLIRRFVPLEDPQLALSPTAVALQLALYTASAIVAIALVKGLVSLGTLPTPSKATAVYVLAVLALIYASAVKLSVDGGVEMPIALLRPDFQALLRAVDRSYLNLAYYTVALVESLFKVLGVAP